jgi:hypothetical protein
MLLRLISCTGLILLAACGRADAGTEDPSSCEQDLARTRHYVGVCAERNAELAGEVRNLEELVRIMQMEIDKLDPEGAAARRSIAEKPTKKEVMDALKAVKPAVQKCGQGLTGVATVSMVFEGKSGKVTSAKVVGGPFKGGPQARCIARAVMKARVPAFLQTTFSVSYPFVIK